MAVTAADAMALRSAVELERLSPGELVLLQSLYGGTTLGEAHALAVDAEGQLDLSAVLRRHVLGGTLVGFRLPG